MEQNDMTTTKNTENNHDRVSWYEKDYTVLAELDTKLRKLEAAYDNGKADIKEGAAQWMQSARERRDAAKEAFTALRSGAKSSTAHLEASARRALDRFKSSVDEAEKAWSGQTNAKHNVQ